MGALKEALQLQSKYFLYSNPVETIIKYFVTNLNKHTTEHQGRASRLLMLRVHTASDTATDLYLRSLS